MHNSEDCFGLIQQAIQGRQSINSKWQSLWRLYRTEPLNLTSNLKWQSRLNDGKVFEVTETATAYIVNTLLFSDNWVELDPTKPGDMEVPFVSQYFRDSLNKSNFARELVFAIRQLVLCGLTAIDVMWDNEKDCLTFSGINVQNIYLEPNKRYDDTSYVVQAYCLSKAEFFAWFSDYVNADELESLWDKEKNSGYNSQMTLRGKSANNDYIYDTSSEAINVYCYTCPIENESYWYANETLFFESDKDLPIIAVLYETPDSAYGVGFIEPAIGLVLENNTLLNRRLDNVAVSVDNMWTVVDDGVINPQDIVSEPGKVINVARHDSILPLRPPANNFQITYQEAAVLESKIDKTLGLGAMLSANTYRQGERVTATEIAAVKEAGGNRLTLLFDYVEREVVLPLLRRAFKVLKENTKKQKIVKLPSEKQGVFNYFKVLPSDLNRDYSLKVLASQSVINRDRNISLITDFMTIVGSVPQMQQLVNWQNLFVDLLTRFGFNDPQRYIQQQTQTQEADNGMAPASPVPSDQALAVPPNAPMSPAQAMVSGLGEIGGQPAADAMSGLLQSPEAMTELMGGMSGVSPDIDPTQLMSTLNTPV